MSHPSTNEERPRPRVYVASLSDYNAGVLHGTWLDATADVGDLREAVERMLDASPTDPHAEEYAIHDYERWLGLRLGEYEPLERIARLAHGIAEHGEAFAVWAANEERDLDALDSFEDAYQGRWESLEAYAESLLNDLGINVEELGPEHLRPYIHFDLASFARDLARDLPILEGEHGVYVFEE